MIIKCPECTLQVSDKAVSCPHCGYPMAKTDIKIRTAKRKRLPNGFGTISELHGNRLVNRFRVMVPDGTDSKGRCKSKMLKPKAYFETYNEAYMALVEYNKNPYDLDKDITVKELYEKWCAEYFKTLKSASSERTITSAWKYCSSIENMNVSSLRSRHIKGCMDSTDSPNTKCRIKSMFNLMLDYAVEYEIIERNYARTFNISSEVLNDKEKSKNSHISFTDEEMNILWKNIEKPYVSYILIQCYMGWRPQELGLIELKNVDLENWNIIGGMKTVAGTNRTVPIHSLLRAIISRLYDESTALGGKYLLTVDGSMLTYDKYRHRFDKLVNELGLNPEHKAHDGRKQFVTMCKRYGVDEYAIKKMAGHNISDITEKIYTDRDPKWLNKEIEKIKLGAVK